MHKIAITGNIATGKSLVARQLTTKGLAVLETDQVINDLYQTAEIKDLLQEKFGLKTFKKDGSINKKFLSELVFNDAKIRNWLEQILWPRAWLAVEFWLFQQEKNGTKFAFVIVPLLFEAHWDEKFDQNWLVSSNPIEILARLQMRDRIDLEEAIRRLATQVPDVKKGSLVDLIINNNDTLDQLAKNIDHLIDNLEYNL